MPNSCSFLNSLHHAEILSFIKTGLLAGAGFFFARLSAKASKKLLIKYASSQQAMLIQKIIYFSVLILFLIAALQQLGFKLSVLLGSAGIATAALAIASQTSISNIISGIFLILEKSFQVGDKIKVGSTTGFVSSIDLLSVKILTANNALIRIPNETLIKSEITNLSRFDMRRLDLSLKVSSDQDIAFLKGKLLEIMTKNSFTLKTPLPSVTVQHLDATGVYLQLSVWSELAHIDTLSDKLYSEIYDFIRANDIQL